MCNICSGRLFLIPNPCCCELRCGVMWIGTLDIVIGLLSLCFPNTIVTTEAAQSDSDDQSYYRKFNPVGRTVMFNIRIPWSETDGYRRMEQSGCHAVQIVTGIALLIAANRRGGYHLSKLLTALCWLVWRIIIFIILFGLANRLYDGDDLPLLRYALFLTAKLILDVYFFVIVEYYAMDNYNAFRYSGSFGTVLSRREPVVTTKAAAKTPMSRAKKLQLRESGNGPQPTEIAFNVKDLSALEEAERVPVWQRKNEVIFYGEDYTDWDPTVFQTKWDILNEKELAKQKITSLHGVTLALLGSKQKRDMDIAKSKGPLQTAPETNVIFDKASQKKPGDRNKKKQPAKVLETSKNKNVQKVGARDKIDTTSKPKMSQQFSGKDQKGSLAPRSIKGPQRMEQKKPDSIRRPARDKNFNHELGGGSSGSGSESDSDFFSTTSQSVTDFGNKASVAPAPAGPPRKPVASKVVRL